MSRRNNNDDPIWLMPFIVLLIMIAFGQCTALSDVKDELRDIKHEIRMLRYK